MATEAEQLEELVEFLAPFKYYPERFVEAVFDWGVGDLEGYDGPDVWQYEELQALGRHFRENPKEAYRVAIASGHGIGKGAMTAWLILWFMTYWFQGKGIVTANTFPQLSGKTWAELALWHSRAIHKDWFTWTATRFAFKEDPSVQFIDAITNSETNSEAFAGLHAKHVLIIFDEASAISQKIFEVTEGAMTTEGAIWFCFGNPTKNTGPFRECFGRFSHRWKNKHIDSRTAKMTDKKLIQEWIDDYGIDSDFVKVRVLGQFPSAGDMQFIPANTAREAADRAAQAAYGSIVMGLDVARFGDDRTVFVFRQGRDGRTIPAQRYRSLDLMDIANRAAQAMDRYNITTCFIDGVGVGGGVIDRLRQMGYGHRIIEVNAGGKAKDAKRFLNKRAEMWSDMRDWLETAMIPNEAELIQDLCGLEYQFDANQRLQLEKKSDMKKRGLASPDWADALALTFAQPVAPEGFRKPRVKRAIG